MVGNITFLMIFAVFDPSPLTLWINRSFYCAMLYIRGTSHGPVSVCVRPSVTSRRCTKTVKRRITQTTPHDSSGTLVSGAKDLREIDRGHPYGGDKYMWGGTKSATFDK